MLRCCSSSNIGGSGFLQTTIYMPKISAGLDDVPNAVFEIFRLGKAAVSLAVPCLTQYS